MRYGVLSFMLGMGLVYAQQQQGQAPSTPAPSAPSTGPGASTPGPTPSPGRTPSPTTPTYDPRQQQQQQFPEMQRPVFLSGKVTLDDGSPPPEPVKIERVCNGMPRPEGYTDSKGRFSIQLGQNSAMFADASVSSAGMDTFGGGSMNNRNRIDTMAPGSGLGGVTERDLMGCELRADLPGYVSDVVNLSGRRLMDNPDVGIIVLRSIAGVEGKAISFTTLAAPKDAKKAYEKAQNSLKKKKTDDAQKELEKAVVAYPKYAVAWQLLGQIHQQAGRPEEARKAFGEALAADSKYVNPYLNLAALSAAEEKWQEVADTTDRLIRLNPIQFPQAYFYNSIANFNLQKWDASEKSAREAVKLDTGHRMPRAQYVLGILLANKAEYPAAVEQIKGYLQFAPQAPDAAQVKKQLTDIEARMGGATTATQQQ